MLIEDLPRLTEEEREALDGYTAIAGVPAHEPIRKTRFRLATIFAAALLAGCSMTPTQQKWAGFAAGVLVVGAIAAHDNDSGKPIVAGDKHGPFNPCPSGDSRNCK